MRYRFVSVSICSPSAFINQIICVLTSVLLPTSISYPSTQAEGIRISTGGLQICEISISGPIKYTHSCVQINERTLNILILNNIRLMNYSKGIGTSACPSKRYLSRFLLFPFSHRTQDDVNEMRWLFLYIRVACIKIANNK